VAEIRGVRGSSPGELPDGIEVLDFFHASEHLHAAVAAVYGDGTRETQYRYETLRETLRDEERGVAKVIRALNYTLFSWQRRRARAHDLPVSHPGAAAFVHRFGSLLNLNCHAHAVLPDGVFAVGPEGAVAFRALPPPWDDDVVRLLAQIARAVEARIARRLADRSDDDAPDRFAQDQPPRCGARRPRRRRRCPPPPVVGSPRAWLRTASPGPGPTAPARPPRPARRSRARRGRGG
jgi:hypothetical protein